MVEPIRLFVGCAASGEDAESCAVLEFSARKHSSLPLEIVWMAQSRDPASFWSGWNSSIWATPFSCFRFGIPAYCNFEGRAIYCDSDVWFQADLAELWGQAFQPGKVIMGRGGGSWRLCVSMWDCAAAKDVLPSLHDLKTNPKALSAATGRLKAGDHIQAFDGDWNCLDGKGYADLSDPRLKACHYTDMSCQPSTHHALKRLAAAGQSHWFDGTIKPHPRADVQAKFDALLAEAIAAGYAVENYIPAIPFGPYRKASLTNYKGAPK